MSEYQYYDFMTVDRPLTAREREELRAVSSRARITATRFSNSYAFGDLRADPAKLLHRYFDAHLYLSNWGTRVLAFRFPKQSFLAKGAKAYGAGSAVSVKARGSWVTVTLRSEDEGEWIDEGDAAGMLAGLLALRAELAAGDHRALYLAWLLDVQAGELPEGATEPPCPPGLKALSAPLAALVEFLRLDEDLLAAAAETSPDLRPKRRGRAVVEGRQAAAPPPRLVRELLAGADRRREAREREAERKAQRERERSERKAAAARERELDALVGNEATAWAEVDSLVATRLPKSYERAARLLRDLRDLGARRGEGASVQARIDQLCAERRQRSAFVRRVRAALDTTPRAAPLTARGRPATSRS